MIENRHIYKKVSVNNRCFLYPMPIIKQAKYLIEVEEEFADFFIFAFEHKMLPSADGLPEFLEESGIHNDGATKIYAVKRPSLKFRLLKHPEEDLEKSQTIETILNKKLTAVLEKQEGSIAALSKTYLNQRKCKTCVQLGINDSSLMKFMNLLGVNIEDS